MARPRTRKRLDGVRPPLARIEPLEPRRLLAYPVAYPGGPYTVGEGTSLPLNGFASDADNDVVAYEWDLDYDTSTFEADLTGRTPTVPGHLLDGRSSRNIALRVTDSAGLSHVATSYIIVTEIPPTLRVTGDPQTQPNVPYVLHLSSTDPGDDQIDQWTIDWGDGVVETVPGNPSSVSHLYGQPRTYRTIRASAMDEDGSYNAPAGPTVRVNAVNSPVSIVSLTNRTVPLNENTDFGFAVSIADDDTTDAHTVTIDKGDGSALVVRSLPAGVYQTTETFRYNDRPGPDDPYTITVTVTDGESSVTQTREIVVVNRAPGVGSINGLYLDEGQSGSITALGVDIDPLTYSWTVRDPAGQVVLTTATQVVSFGPADDGVYTATATITDSDGAQVDVSRTITVRNVAPTLRYSGPRAVVEGRILEGTFWASDPGPDTVHAWSVNWGDGSPAEQRSGAGPQTFTHTFLDGNASPAPSITVTDEDGTYVLPLPITPVAPKVDTTFGGTGSRVYSTANTVIKGREVLVQPDGKVILVGDRNVSSGISEWIARRYDATGFSEHTFSPISVGTSGSTSVNAAALRPDGRIILAGRITPGGTSAGPLLAQYDASGNIDTSFGNSGKMAFTYGYTFNDVAALPDGRVLAVGSGFGGSATGQDMLLVRLTASGSPDLSFGSAGRVFLDFGEKADEEAHAVVVRPDGIYVAGISNGHWALARLTLNGSLDTTAFNNTGKVRLRVGGLTDASTTIRDLAFNPDGSILAVGTARDVAGPSTGRDWVVAKFIPSGALDPTFGEQGLASVDADGDGLPHALVRQPDGNVLVAGSSGSSNDVGALLLLGPDGRPYDTFGPGGLFTLAANSTALFGVALQPDGKVLTAGQNGSAGQVSRFVVLTDAAITVNNAAPSLNVFGANTHVTGAPYALELSAADAGPDTVNRWTVNWGDGSATQFFDSAVVSTTHAYLPGTYTLAITARDEDGTYTASSKTITVTYRAPVLQDGLLTVTGSDAADTVLVHRGDAELSDRLFVRVGNESYDFPFADVERVAVNALAGNDTIGFGEAPSASVDLGDGLDQLFTGPYTLGGIALGAFAGPLTVAGGAGDDQLDLGQTPAHPVHFDGGAGTFDRLVYRGTGGDDAFTVRVDSLSLGVPAFPDPTFANVERVTASAGAGNDTFFMDTGGTATSPIMVLNGGDGNDALTVLSAPGSGGISVTFSGDAGDDVFSVPSGVTFLGATFNGGTGADTIAYDATDANNKITLFSRSISVDAQFASLNYSLVEGIRIDARGGNDTFVVQTGSGPAMTLRGGDGDDTYDVTASISATFRMEGGAGDDVADLKDASYRYTLFAGGTGADTLNLRRATLYFLEDASLTTDRLTLNLFGGGWTGSFAALESSQHLAALNVHDGAIAQVFPGGARTLFVNDLFIAPTAVLEMCDNDLVVNVPAERRAEMTEKLRDWIRTGRGTGAWDGTNGITSDAARKDVSRRTGLALADTAGGLFVKYTWAGDADADGRVTADDYYRIDRGFLTRRAVYWDGDFNFDGRIDLDDYALIDESFLGQDRVW